jgi:hypothetical protein
MTVDHPQALQWELTHIVQPKRALDQRIAGNAHYLDRDQSRLRPPGPECRSRREISQQFPPAAGAQQVFGTGQYLIAIIYQLEIRH